MTLLAIGCAPPDALELGATEAAPEIRLIHPDADSDFSLNPDGTLSFLVVVDLVNITFVQPAGGATATDGEAHWHMNINDAYVDAPAGLYYEYSSGAFQSGDAVKLSVTLQDNEHADLDQFDDWESILEFQIP